MAFRVAIVAFALAALEEVAITIVLPEWKADVPTVRYAWRARSL